MSSASISIRERRERTLAIPTSIAWSNFSDAWDTGVKDYFWNSVIIASIKVPLGVVIEAMAAFALTHIPFRMRLLRLVRLSLFIHASFERRWKVCPRR